MRNEARDGFCFVHFDALGHEEIAIATFKNEISLALPPAFVPF
jgi:hypothetical protein